MIMVNPLPEIILGEWPEMLCNVGVPPVQLTAQPEGGIYSGNGVSPDGLFDPQTASIGWNVITYTFTDNNSCTQAASDSIYVDNCVGINETSPEMGRVKIYPNPNNGTFKVFSEKPMNMIMVTDQNGRLVYSRKTNTNEVVIEDIKTKGIYHIMVYFLNGNSSPVLVSKEVLVQ